MEYVIVLIVLAVVIYAISSPFRADRRVIAGHPGQPGQPGQTGAPSPAAAVVHPSAPLTQDAVAELEAARDAKYREIRDAELDVRTGKLSDADYEALDGALRGEAVEILHALDEARKPV
ncbi:MAG: hypothetical protein ACR2NR_06960 [Solirubrobacteraceae bacterium]